MLGFSTGVSSWVCCPIFLSLSNLLLFHHHHSLDGASFERPTRVARWRRRVPPPPVSVLPFKPMTTCHCPQLYRSQAKDDNTTYIYNLSILRTHLGVWTTCFPRLADASIDTLHTLAQDVVRLSNGVADFSWHSFPFAHATMQVECAVNVNPREQSMPQPNILVCDHMAVTPPESATLFVLCANRYYARLPTRL